MPKATTNTKVTRGRPTQDDLEKRKQRVLEIAEKLFMTRGFAGTSVSEIAKRARVSPRLISAHLGGKADIFTHVINSRSLEASRLAEETIHGKTAEEVLLGAAHAAWQAFYSPGAVNFTRLVVGEGARFKDQTETIGRVSAHYFHDRMRPVFADLQERGLIDLDDIDKNINYFIDLIVGRGLPAACMGYWGSVSNEDEIREKVRLFCRAVGTAETRQALNEPDSILSRAPKVASVSG